MLNLQFLYNNFVGPDGTVENEDGLKGNTVK